MTDERDHQDVAAADLAEQVFGEWKKYDRDWSATVQALGNEAAEAQRSFATAAVEPGPFVAEALYGAARNAEVAGDAGKAKELYTQLLEKHPTTEYRDVATAHLVALGGTPPATQQVTAGAAPAASE